MAVLGISYSAAGDRPQAIGVAGEGSPEKPKLERIFHHEGDKQEDKAQALLGLVDKVESVLGQRSFEVVVVNSMDMPVRAKIKYVQVWFRIEGGLLAVAKRRTDRVFALTGMQIGSRVGLGKDGAEQRAGELLQDEDAARAGAAALAALAILNP